MENGIVTLEDQINIIRDRLRRLEDKINSLEHKGDELINFMSYRVETLEYKVKSVQTRNADQVRAIVQDCCKGAREEYLAMVEQDKKLFELIVSRFRRFYKKHI